MLVYQHKHKRHTPVLRPFPQPKAVHNPCMYMYIHVQYMHVPSVSQGIITCILYTYMAATLSRYNVQTKHEHMLCCVLIHKTSGETGLLLSLYVVQWNPSEEHDEP